MIQTENFQIRLIEWYRTHQRRLPWRTEPSLYRTVVSELMAQQTQIKTMLPYFERWMQRFPDFEALAIAPQEDVLKHWEGLGYYSRARNLHKLAKAYCAAAPKPSTREAWQALPGIGPYTSAAIASIAFNQPSAVIDGNVVRILARLTKDQRSFKNNGEAVKAFTPLAEEVLNPDRPGDHNQAMMELGATICFKAKPHCSICPVRPHCLSYGLAHVESIPHIQRKATQVVEIHRAWIKVDERILLYRIPETSGQLAGQYELPDLEAIGLAVPEEPSPINKTRSITNRRYKERIHPMLDPQLIDSIPLSKHPLSWVSLDELETLTLSGPHRKWVKELLEQS
ncbi:MAG: A/G-specific adenine glycosylase [Verrucomicrobiota bacterium]